MHKPSVIEDIYPLSPMQEGMLFHTLLAPRSGVYVEQQSWSYYGDLNIHAFIQAWQLAVDRHPILRTAFLYENREKPLQVVRRRAALKCSLIDWSDCSPAEQDVLLERFLNADRSRGFLLSSPSQIRLTLIRLGPQSYEVVWTHHHLLLDGWSVPVLLREVGLSYQAFSQGENLRLPPAEPYSRYIAWLKQQDLNAAEKFWRERLQGFDTPTRLGVDQDSRVQHDSKSGFGEHRIFLNSATTARLQALTRLLRVTTNTVIQGVWAFVLGQYSGEDDVVFGATVSGRPVGLSGIEAMIGLFINTVPVRVTIAGAEPISEWLKRLQEQQVEARQYEYTPLIQIQGWSGVARSQRPFDSLLVFENYPVRDAKPRQGRSTGKGNGNGSHNHNIKDSNGSAQQAEGSGNGKLEVRNVRAYEQVHYPLSIVAGLIPDLIFRLLYDRSRLSQSAIQRLGQHLETVLDTILTAPEQPLRTVSLLSPAERHQLLVEWNDTASALPRELSLVELFEQQVERSPDAVALSFADGQLTYSALNRRANQLAHHLHAVGLGPAMVCGLFLPRSTSLIVSILAVLKAGAVYLPLDLSYPAERLAFMITKTGARFLLTDQNVALSLPVEQQTVVDLERDATRIAGYGEHNPPPQASGLNVAYINFTSGSTGQPKGIVIPHAAVTRLVLNTNYVQLNARDRVAQGSNASFDAMTFEVWGVLLNGARLVGVDHETVLTPLRYALQIRAEQLTVMFMTTALFNQMAREAPWAFRDVQTLLFGGEAVEPRWVRELRDQGYEGRLLHVYGPTESTTFSTWHGVETVPAGARTVPIGQAVGNTSVYVLDRRQRLVASGVEGELYIAGEGLAYGYVESPVETAVSFLPDEWSTQTGARMYRTGDLVRRGEQGGIEYLGRVDHQVKIRGFRIEPEEIGVVLGEHPSVEETVVVVRDQEDGDRQLVAYVVVKPGQQRSKHELRSYLKSRLPDYMVPAVYVWMERMPLNANGKVDRRALPPPQKEERKGERREGTGTAAEEIVAGIFEQVLNVSDVSVGDSFFDLGGHSLLATQVTSRVREVFKVDVPLRDLFDGPTVRELAGKVEQLLAAGAGDDAPPLQKLERREGEEIPLSFAQQRLWFLDQLLPDKPIYLVPIALKIDGALNIPRLEQSLNHIVQRHEVLRTTIGVNSGRAVQVINQRKLELGLVDLSGLTGAERQTIGARLIAEEARRRFDLSHDMLLRARLLQASSQEHVLLLTFHHIVTDGWSTGVFIGEFNQLYRDFQQGDPATLPELPIQYADFATWQRGWLQGEALEKQFDYWRQQLTGTAHLLELPIDRPRSAIQASRRHRESFVLSQSLSEALVRLGGEQKVTLFMTLLAALQGLLARCTGQTDFCIGSPIANRNRADVEGLIGFFVNMLVLRA
ncbi:MAG TPA: amino acid adenylation domain-containing protein, partial [Pyrinomonadaceae bacterium]